MSIRLHDSLSREARELAPSHADGFFRFYNCGPTVYAPAHIGNFRTFVVNDLIRRLLEIEFGPDRVRHVRNLTDVDDKTIRRSREEKRPLADVTLQWTEKFHADCTALGCLPPHVEPAATTHIAEQIDMIAILERKGHAYRAADGSVYFKVNSFPGYGALSRVKERELKPGSALASGNAAPAAAHDSDEKEDGSDFALWKARKPEDGDVFWPSPWGQGRPGWHIECSAMSKKHLGDTIDLHTGGVDLLFPHHENEIAQSQCCNGTLFARHWYHSEHLLVDGKKMSKSLNNLYTLDQLREMGHTPAALRYALLAGHPRKQLNFTLDSLHAAEKALATLRHFRDSLVKRGLKPDHAPSTRFDAVLNALREDLNTPAALGALFGEINSYDHRPAHHGDLAAFDRVIQQALGLDLTPLPPPPPAEIPAETAALAEQRWTAKQQKNYAAADALRAQIAATGWTMIDRKDGYSLEPAKK
ncbi:cysteine--tRNA ligase [Geminisphaera colitermitum]|uniref:cysteine--tRNA ligase n=1 Tax=Geminisphaera colitermitum TaxID=1148786 RepID=UPI0001964E04|nr:cysteine--tRNA ligase [Geminisphaera colitermitum]